MAEDCMQPKLIHSTQRELFDCLRSSLEAFHCKCCDFNTYFTICFKEHTRVHRPLHKTEKKIYCKRCRLNVSSWFWLHHRKQCSSISCQFCDFRTSRSFSLRSHIAAKHAAPENLTWYQCGRCPYKTKFNKSLTRHTRSVHEDVGIFQCELCPFTANKQSVLKLHVARQHTPELLKWFHCDQCPFKADDKRKLKRHSVQHIPPENTDWFRCDKCPYKTAVKCYLAKHVLYHLEQENVQWYQCGKCPFRTKSKLQFHEHTSTQHVPPESVVWFRCPKCPFRTQLERYLQKHVAANHKNDVLFDCGKCSFKAAYRGQLEQHVKLTHAARAKVKWNVVSVKIIRKQSGEKIGNS